MYIYILFFNKVIKSLQTNNGFKGDNVLCEIDSRFTYCAISALSLLKKLDNNNINIFKATSSIIECMNLDGGFGCSKNRESHAGQGKIILINYFCFLLCWGFKNIRQDGFNR